MAFRQDAVASARSLGRVRYVFGRRVARATLDTDGTRVLGRDGRVFMNSTLWVSAVEGADTDALGDATGGESNSLDEWGNAAIAATYTNSSQGGIHILPRNSL